jgi:hypothetical protein
VKAYGTTKSGWYHDTKSSTESTRRRLKRTSTKKAYCRNGLVRRIRGNSDDTIHPGEDLIPTPTGPRPRPRPDNAYA